VGALVEGTHEGDPYGCVCTSGKEIPNGEVSYTHEKERSDTERVFGKDIGRDGRRRRRLVAPPGARRFG